jgi:hypothetical protein
MFQVKVMDITDNYISSSISQVSYNDRLSRPYEI